MADTTAHNNEQQSIAPIGKRDQSARAALARLYRAYYRPMIYALRRIDTSLTDEEREDIVQQVFMEVWEGRWKHNGLSSTMGHLLRRARSRIIDYKRRDAARRGHELDREPPGFDPNPNTTIRLNEQKELVRWALTQLPAEQRQAIELIHLQGLTRAQAATVVGCTPQALAKRYQRARRSFAQSLAFLDDCD